LDIKQSDRDKIRHGKRHLFPNIHVVICPIHSPAQHTQHKVENKEGSKDDQANKVNPRQLKPNSIIHLQRWTGKQKQQY